MVVNVCRVYCFKSPTWVCRFFQILLVFRHSAGPVRSGLISTWSGLVRSFRVILCCFAHRWRLIFYLHPHYVRLSCFHVTGLLCRGSQKMMNRFPPCSDGIAETTEICWDEICFSCLTSKPPSPPRTCPWSQGINLALPRYPYTPDVFVSWI